MVKKPVEENHVIAHLEITRVVREFRPMKLDRYGSYTIGNRIDELIAEAIESERSEIQDIAVHFEREQWEAMRKQFYEIGEPIHAVALEQD